MCTKNVSTDPQTLLDQLAAGADPLQLAVDLLSRALSDGDQRKSCSHCHLPGLDSVVLYDHGPGGMVRFYFAHHGLHQMSELIGDAGHFNLGIHNHRYDIAKVSLNELIFNARTSPVEPEHAPAGSREMWEYRFSSALKDGGMGVDGGRRRLMTPVRLDPMHPGSVTMMRAEDLHTIQVPRRQAPGGAAWLVVEGPTQSIQPLIYSPREGLNLVSDGLYEPMAPELAAQRTRRALQLARETLYRHR